MTAPVTRRDFLNVVKDLQYADTERRGYLLLKVTPAEVQGQWCYVSTVKEAAYTLERSAPLVYRA